MSGIIGKKVGMTSIFDADGKNIPCTVIEAGPCVVTQVRTIEKDGYTAVQFAYDEKKEKNTTTQHHHASLSSKGEEDGRDNTILLRTTIIVAVEK